MKSVLKKEREEKISKRVIKIKFSEVLS